MAKEDLNRLIAALESNRALQSEFRAASSSEQKRSVAARHGHDVALEDLEGWALILRRGEHSDAELEGVSGGCAPKTPSIMKTKHDTVKNSISNVR